MGKKRVTELANGDKIKGNGVVKIVKDFGNRVIVESQEGLTASYGAYDEVEVED
jgi:hypothetical protein